MEAVGFIVRRNIEVIEGMGVQVDEIRALGGGARSRIWKQIEADITRRPVVTTTNEEAATLGAAILAGKAVDLYTSISRGRRARWFKSRSALSPIQPTTPVYDEAFATYVQLYEPCVRCLSAAQLEEYMADQNRIASHWSQSRAACTHADQRHGRYAPASHPGWQVPTRQPAAA